MNNLDLYKAIAESIKIPYKDRFDIDAFDHKNFQAYELEIHLNYDDSVIIEVSDDGIYVSIERMTRFTPGYYFNFADPQAIQKAEQKVDEIITAWLATDSKDSTTKTPTESPKKEDTN